MSLGEVLGRDLPAESHTNHARAEVVDGKRNHPDGDARVAVYEAGDDEKQSAEKRRRRESEKHAAARWIVAGDDRHEGDMQNANEEVRNPEQDGVVFEGAWHRQCDAEHCGHRAEHRQPDPAVVDIDRARQPRVHGPCPPERPENEHPAEYSTPGWFVRKQDRDLGDREHEHQVEEQLKRRD